MIAELYQKKLNDIIFKAPLESGVQMLVYELLNELIEHKTLTLVFCDSGKRDKTKKDDVFFGDGGFPDLCIVSNDFIYHNDSTIADNKKKRYGCVEVKSTDKVIPNARKNNDKEYGQLIGHINEFKKVIHTNGIVWQYYECVENTVINEKELKSFAGERDKDKFSGKKEIHLKWSINLCDDVQRTVRKSNKKVIINNTKYQKLIEKLYTIQWENDNK